LAKVQRALQKTLLAKFIRALAVVSSLSGIALASGVASANTIRQVSQDVQLLTARWTGLLTGSENPIPQTGNTKTVNFNDCTYRLAARPAGYRIYDCGLAYENLRRRPGVVGTNFLIDTLEWLAAPSQNVAGSWVQADTDYQGSYEFEVVIRRGALDTGETLGFLEERVTTSDGAVVARDILETREFDISSSAVVLLLPEKTVALNDGTPGLVYRFLMVGPKYSYASNNTSVGVEIKPYIQYVGKSGTIYQNYDSFPSATTSYKIDLNYPLDRSQSILSQ
jgi:hypothetical protein